MFALWENLIPCVIMIFTYVFLNSEIFPTLIFQGMPKNRGKNIEEKNITKLLHYTNISIFLMCFCIITFFIFLYKICQIRKKSPPRRFGRPKPRKARFCATRHPVGGIPRLAERHGDFFLQKSTGV